MRIFNGNNSWIILVIAISGQLQGFSQLGDKRKFAINDTLPDMVFLNVLNFGSGNLRFSELRGKLIILDFWNHHCKPCVEAFPEIDSLQKKLSDRVQFILVNRESKDSTLRFFSRRRKIKKP